MSAGPRQGQPSPLRTELFDGVVELTICRPRVRNAIDRATAEQIAVALDDFEADPHAQIAIISGDGGTFCSGMDLKAFLRGESPVHEIRGFAGLVRKPPTKPIIAAVEGFALAGGFEIALACDLIVAASDAVFGLPEVRRGLVSAAGGLLRLPRRMPYNIAMEIALTGGELSARRAYELGLINRLAPPGSALSVARALAREITANGPLAVTASKRIITESQDWGQSDGFERQEAIVAPVRRSRDAKEGARAFAEKREPIWRGE